MAVRSPSVVRLLGVGTVGALLVVAWSSRAASPVDASAIWGEQPASAAALVVTAEIDGQRFAYLPGQTARSLAEVVGWFAGRCGPGGASPLAWQRALTRVGPPPAPIAAARAYPHSVAVDVAQGMVTCLDLGRRPPPDPERLLLDLARSRRLPDGVEGQLLYAHRTARGTSYVVTWNPRALDLAAFTTPAPSMAAPPPGAPREFRSREVFSAAASGHLQALRVLASAGPAQALRVGFAARLRAAGWQVVVGERGLIYGRLGARTIWLGFDDRDGEAWTTFVDDAGP